MRGTRQRLDVARTSRARAVAKYFEFERCFRPRRVHAIEYAPAHRCHKLDRARYVRVPAKVVRGNRVELKDLDARRARARGGPADTYSSASRGPARSRHSGDHCKN